MTAAQAMGTMVSMLPAIFQGADDFTTGATNKSFLRIFAYNFISGLLFKPFHSRYKAVSKNEMTSATALINSYFFTISANNDRILS